MTNNPLIAKYEELYGKKEEPKPDYYKGEKSYAEELKELRDTSCVPANTPNIITKANHIPSLTSYDYDSGTDSFLQIAEKVKNKDARVTSVTLNRDAVGGFFSTGLTTITFEVQVWDI
jgi:hypothetical protein